MCVPVAQQADNPASSPDEGDRSAQHERKHSSSAVSSDEVKQPLESDSEYVHVDKVRMSNLSIINMWPHWATIPPLLYCELNRGSTASSACALQTSLPADDRRAAARAPLKNNGSAASMFSSGTARVFALAFGVCEYVCT